MELLEHAPGSSQLGVGGEEGLETDLFALTQAISAAQGQESGTEDVGFEGGMNVSAWLPALDAPSHLDQAGGEPPNGWKRSSTWVACPRWRPTEAR